MTPVRTHPPRVSVGPLLSDILEDVQELVQENLALFREETKEHLQEGLNAARPMFIGIGLLGAAGLMFVFGLVYLLSWLFPALPLWACYGLVAVTLGVLGWILFAFGKEKMAKVDPVPEKALAELKENMPWNGNQT